MLDLFFQESSEHLQTLESDLIALEASPEDTSRLNSIFRAVHSIKGAAGFFGFAPIVGLAHVMESVMSLLRDGSMQVDAAIVSLLISTTDKLNVMLADPDRAGEVACANETNGLKSLISGENPANSAQPEIKTNNLPEPIDFDVQGILSSFEIREQDLIPALKHGRNFYVIQFAVSADLESQQQNLGTYFRELESLGQIIDIHTSVPDGTSIYFTK